MFWWSTFKDPTPRSKESCAQTCYQYCGAVPCLIVVDYIQLCTISWHCYMPQYNTAVKEPDTRRHEQCMNSPELLTSPSTWQSPSIRPDVVLASKWLSKSVVLAHKWMPRITHGLLHERIACFPCSTCLDPKGNIKPNQIKRKPKAATTILPGVYLLPPAALSEWPPRSHAHGIYGIEWQTLLSSVHCHELYLRCVDLSTKTWKYRPQFTSSELHLQQTQQTLDLGLDLVWKISALKPSAFLPPRCERANNFVEMPW